MEADLLREKRKQNYQTSENIFFDKKKKKHNYQEKREQNYQKQTRTNLSKGKTEAELSKENRK